MIKINIYIAINGNCTEFIIIPPLAVAFKRNSKSTVQSKILDFEWFKVSGVARYPAFPSFKNPLPPLCHF